MSQKGELVEGYISVITLIELLRGMAAGKRSYVKKVSEYLYEIIPLDNKVMIEYCSMCEAFRNNG
ncbi:MAG: hypothetical protein QXH12_04800 [Candidatus Caldarchaeum sp.]